MPNDTRKIGDAKLKPCDKCSSVIYSKVTITIELGRNAKEASRYWTGSERFLSQ